MEPVRIRRSGNVLEIIPAMQDLLDPVLSYNHRYMNYDPHAADRSMLIRKRDLYRVDGNKLYTTQGALQLVIDTFKRYKVPCVYEDLRSERNLEPDYEHLKMCMPELQFRLKQDEILAHLIGKGSGVIVAPTAYGKTFIMLALAALYPKANIIMASPSTALLRGTYRRMLNITTQVGRVGGGQKDPRRVTLSTYQSIMHANPEQCDILLIDECHRVAAPRISGDIARIRNPVKIFGMTATPKGRSDGADLSMEVLLGPIIYRIPYEEAAEHGLIAKIKVAMVDMPSGCCRIRSCDRKTKPAKKRWCYWRNEVRNSRFANALLTWPEKCGIKNPQTLVLTETTEHAFRMARHLPGFEVVYAGMDKGRQSALRAQGLLPDGFKPLTTAQRDNMLKDFEDGRLRSVIATGCWGEGVDFVHLDVVANMSGEPSPITATQWGGRNSRLHDDKEFGLLIDSIDQWDTWANSRAKRRMTTYRKNKWEIVKGADL